VRGNPIDSRTFHGHGLYATGLQPLRHSDELRRGSSEVRNFATDAAGDGSAHPVSFAPQVDAGYVAPNYRQALGGPIPPPDPGPRPIVPRLPHGAVAVERSPAPIGASVVPGIATASTPSSTAGDRPATDEHRRLTSRVTVPGWRVVSHRRAPPQRGGPWRLRPRLRACAARSPPTDPKRRTTI